MDVDTVLSSRTEFREKKTQRKAVMDFSSSARALSSAITPIYPAFECAQYFIKAKMDMKQMFHKV